MTTPNEQTKIQPYAWDLKWHSGQLDICRNNRMAELYAERFNGEVQITPLYTEADVTRQLQPYKDAVRNLISRIRETGHGIFCKSGPQLNRPCSCGHQADLDECAKLEGMLK